MDTNNNKVTVSAVPFNPQTQTFNPNPQVPNVSAVSATPKTDIAAFNQSMVNYNNPNPTIAIDNLNTPKTTIPTSPIIAQAPQITNQADALLQQTAVAETEAQKTSQSISKALMDIIPNLQGQTQELANQQRIAGLPALRQNLQNINSQILQKQAELNQDDIKLVQAVQNIEDKPIAMEFITGQQQSVQRNAQIARALKSAEIGVLNAQALGAQGNIALAEATAKQAVETKYAPYKEALDLYKMQLEALQPQLTADEKKQAREQEIKTKLAFNDIEKRQKNEEDVSKIIVNAASQGAPQTLVDKAKMAKDPATAASILGIYAGDYWGTKMKIAQYNKTIAETAAARGTGGGAGTAPGQSVAQAYLDQFNAGSLELSDVYTKIGSSKDAQKIKNEFARLVAAQGGKRVLKIDDAQVAAIDEQIKNIDDLIGTSGYNYKVISGLSQGGAFGFGGRATGAKDDALAIAENLVANQTLQSLADAKAKGITFGALSGPELNAVASAASRLASKAIKDKDTGKITGFSGSESGFKADLDKVREGLVKAKEQKTGGTGVTGKVDRAIQILNSDIGDSTGGYIFNQ